MSLFPVSYTHLELLAQLLRPVYGQAVVCPVPWVKADDIVVAFHIFPFLVFLIAEISPHTGNSEILAPAVKGRNAVILPRYQPPVFIKGCLLYTSAVQQFCPDTQAFEVVHQVDLNMNEPRLCLFHGFRLNAKCQVLRLGQAVVALGKLTAVSYTHLDVYKRQMAW